MKKLSLVVGIGLSLLLTACGGNGNGGGGGAAAFTLGATPVVTSNTQTDTDTADTTDTANTTTNTTSNNNQTTPSFSVGVFGNAIGIDQNKMAGANVATETSSTVNQITVGGQTIKFVPDDFANNSIVNSIDVTNGVGRLGVKLEHSNFGYFQGNVDVAAHLFSQGNVSSSVPVAGTVEYIGTVVHFDNGEQNKLKNPTGLSVINEVSFFADFTDKKVTGTVGGGLNIEGKITDNQFSGEKDGVATYGYFYGDNANELGGTYKKTDGTSSGAYGATRRE